MTRREQLNVAGCSCRRLRHRSYFATLISSRRGLFTVAPSTSLYIKYLARPPPSPPPPPSLSSLSKLQCRPLFGCDDWRCRRTTPFAFCTCTATTSAPFYDPRKIVTTFYDRTHTRGSFEKKNDYNSLIKSHDPIPPFRILRWYVQRFIVCRSGRVRSIGWSTIG